MHIQYWYIISNNIIFRLTASKWSPRFHECVYKVELAWQGQDFCLWYKNSVDCEGPSGQDLKHIFGRLNKELCLTWGIFFLACFYCIIFRGISTCIKFVCIYTYNNPIFAILTEEPRLSKLNTISIGIKINN